MKLSEILKPFSYRVLKEDCLDLPDKTYKREVELTEEQKSLFYYEIRGPRFY
jgi:hypothetical protein